MRHRNELAVTLTCMAILELLMFVLCFFVGARWGIQDIKKVEVVTAPVEDTTQETTQEPRELIITHEYVYTPLPVDYEPLTDCVNVGEDDAVLPKPVLAEVPPTDEREDETCSATSGDTTAEAEEDYIVECEMPEDLQRLLYSACDEFGVDYVLALSVVSVESNFKNVMGDGGNAYGYMQIQQRFHTARMERLGVTDLMDAESNFRVGCDLLSELIGKYGTVGGLTAYNTGRNGTSAYATKVLARYAEYSGGDVLIP